MVQKAAPWSYLNKHEINYVGCIPELFAAKKEAALKRKGRSYITNPYKTKQRGNI